MTYSPKDINFNNYYVTVIDSRLFQETFKTKEDALAFIERKKKDYQEGYSSYSPFPCKMVETIQREI